MENSQSESADEQEGGKRQTDRLSRNENTRIHLSTLALLDFFKSTHLPDELKEVSMPFCELAEHMVDVLPGSAETTVMLRKLLEAKDCAVRSRLQAMS